MREEGNELAVAVATAVDPLGTAELEGTAELVAETDWPCCMEIVGSPSVGALNSMT